MRKLYTSVYIVLMTVAAIAAPTANEDFVVEEDAKTYTNAVNAAKSYTDAQIALIPSPDFSAENAALVATIEEVAPAPGNYSVVSNKAMTAVQPGELSSLEDALNAAIATKADASIHYIATNDYFTLLESGERFLPTEVGDWGVPSYYCAEADAELLLAMTFVPPDYEGTLMWHHMRTSATYARAPGEEGVVPYVIEMHNGDNTYTFSRIVEVTGDAVYTSDIEHFVNEDEVYSKLDTDMIVDSVTNRTVYTDAWWTAPDSTAMYDVTGGERLMWKGTNSTTGAAWLLKVGRTYYGDPGASYSVGTNNTIVANGTLSKRLHKIISDIGDFTMGQTEAGLADTEDVGKIAVSVITSIDETAEPTVEELWNILLRLKHSFEELKEE